MDPLFLVTTPYSSSNSEPLAFRSGEHIDVEERECEWPGWTWCRDRSGGGGWVPDPYFIRRGNRAVACRDYDAVELSVRMGEIIIGARRESGWIWCTAPSGVSGWVPCRNLIEISDRLD